MERTVTAQQDQDVITRKKNRRFETNQIAWVVLLTSFSVFCSICVGFSFGIQFFFFRSTIPMTVSVGVSRGSVGLVRTDLSESFEVDGRFLSPGDMVLTDSQSQAVVSLRNSDENNELIASVTLKNNSALVISEAIQPRFDWIGRNYQMMLTANRGEFDIFVPDDLNRDISLSVILPERNVIDVGNSGSYTISVRDDEIRLDTQQGQAAFLPMERQNSRSVVSGQRGIYEIETGAVLVEPGYEDLVGNSSFIEPPSLGFTGSSQITTLPVIGTWHCSDRTLSVPRGDFQSLYFDGQPTVHLIRGQNARSHGETACIQPFGPSGQVGLRVDAYSYLEVRAKFMIEYHSLDACGEQGSECPLMLLMDYVDVDGDSNQWFHGFYSKLESRSDYPSTCVSCQQEHKRINDSVWYTFESGNLFSLLPPERRPASILNIRFYASGHEYDVYMSGLSLFATPLQSPVN